MAGAGGNSAGPGMPRGEVSGMIEVCILETCTP